MTEKLYRALRQTRRSCTINPEPWFVPIGCINDLVTATAVQEILKEGRSEGRLLIDDRSIYPVAQMVLRSARRLFAILAYLKIGYTICAFLQHNLSDKDLPLICKKKNGDDRFRLFLRDALEEIDCGLDEEDIEGFDRIQKSMLAPIFSKNHTDCVEVPDNIVLPFPHLKKLPVWKDLPEISAGAYSEVTIHSIHSDHHNFWEGDQPQPEEQYLIADKKLTSHHGTNKYEQLFQREKATFEALSLQKHEHLTSLLASYRTNGYYHMILPRAMGDLKRFWHNFQLPDFVEKTVLWSAEQISGLLDALKTVHTFELKEDLIILTEYRVQDDGGCMVVKAGEERYGRHGDLKPENILYFEHDGKLKITDFGLCRFHGRDSRSGIDAKKVRGTLTYEPPECTLETSVSRKYDIWSMGCIVLEFVTWLLLGCDGIEEFANRRGEFAPLFIGGRVESINDDTFFTVLKEDLNDKDSQKYAVVRQGVRDWVVSLHSSDKCSSLMHDLLDLVMNHMLLIEQEERMASDKLTEEMAKLVSKAKHDRIYLLEPAPWPLPTPLQRNTAISKSVHWEDEMSQSGDMKPFD